MLQILLEEASDVNGIVNAGKAWFSFIGVAFIATKELICEGEAIAKW